MTLVLALNAGSSSLRFAAQDGAGHVPWRGRISGLGTPQARLSWQTGGDGPVMLGALDHRQAIDWLLERIARDHPGNKLLAVGHRVVHGGPHQHKPARVDAAMLSELDALVPLAPLHQPHCLYGIRAVQQRRPDLPQFACFDTAFHASRPALEQRLALPELPELTGVQSYGFHGLSYEYLTSRLPDRLGATADGRVILAHLGQGASLCALRDRTSQATTMSFTPLDGLPMGSRCGSCRCGWSTIARREASRELGGGGDRGSRRGCAAPDRDLHRDHRALGPAPSRRRSRRGGFSAAA